MPVDPQAQAILDMMLAMGGKPFEEMSLEDIQATRKELAKGMGLSGEGAPVARTENRAIRDIPVRVYWPSTEENLPVLVYAHGGGWVFGTLDWVDATCRDLCHASGGIVVSVDYRLAPEHRFPAAAEDVYAVTRYIAENPAEFGADATRVAVGGDSAGGNLAAVTCQMARDRKAPSIVFQLLVYPCVNYFDDSPSMKENAEGYFLTTSGMKWFWEQYASPDLAREPYLSPLQAKNLRNLPPALVISAEYDPLRDQGEIYARKLVENGGEAMVRRFPGVIHAFFHMSGAIDQGRVAVEFASESLRKAFTRTAVAP